MIAGLSDGTEVVQFTRRDTSTSRRMGSQRHQPPVEQRGVDVHVAVGDYGVRFKNRIRVNVPHVRTHERLQAMPRRLLRPPFTRTEHASRVTQTARSAAVSLGAPCLLADRMPSSSTNSLHMSLPNCLS